MTPKQKQILDAVVKEILVLSAEEFRAKLKEHEGGDISLLLDHSGVFKPSVEEMIKDLEVYDPMFTYHPGHSEVWMGSISNPIYKGITGCSFSECVEQLWRSVKNETQD